MPACYVNQARKSRLMEALNRRENAVTRNTNRVSVVQRMELPHRDNLTRLYIGYTRSSCTSINKWYTGHRVQAVHLTATHNTRSLPCFEGEPRSWTGGHESCSPRPMCRLLSHAPSITSEKIGPLAPPPSFFFLPLFSSPPLPPFPPDNTKQGDSNFVLFRVSTRET